VRLGFCIGNLSSSVDLLVSDCVDEIMLGVDFLTQHNCRWYFDRKQIDIDGQVVPLKSQPSHATVRRVIVQEDTCVAPRTQTNVPVQLNLSSWRSPHADWLVESKRWRPGVFMSRTLLSDDSDFAAVKVVNTTAYKLAAVLHYHTVFTVQAHEKCDTKCFAIVA